MDKTDKNRFYSQRRSSNAKRTRSATESWHYLTTGITDAAKAIVGGNENDTWERIDSASAVNALQYKSIQEDALCNAAQLNDLTLLQRAYEEAREVGVDIAKRTDAGETAFHIAVLFDSVEAALKLLDYYPPFLHMVYTNKLYKGQHVLHIAVVNQNLDLVKEFVRRGASINVPRALGTFFNPSSPDNQVYWGEHVLAFAACTFQKDIVEYLLRKNADITVVDCQGNNLLHLLVLQPDVGLACEMYSFISSLQMTVDERLEGMTNKKGFTPLQLAAFEGKKKIFSLIMESRKEIHWTFGPVTSSIYNLKELDTFEEKNSVLDVIVRSEAENVYELLEVQPIPQLLSEKWTNFGFFFFMQWMVLYIGYMVIFTLVVFNRPVMESNQTYCTCQNGEPVRMPSNCPCDGDLFREDNGTLVINTPLACSVASYTIRPALSGAYSSTNDFIRLAGEIIVLLGAIASILWEGPDLYRRGWKGYLTSVGSGAFHVASWLYAALVLAAFGMRLGDSAHQDAILSLALVCGWMFVLYFGRAFHFVGPYIIMCQKMLSGDILRFGIIFIAVSVGFSGALFNLFLEAQPRPPLEWDSFASTFVTLFQLATGLTDIQPSSYERATSQNTVIAFLLVYLIIAFILLVNLLIATMGSTHGRIESERHGLWKKQLASVILLLERRIARSWRVRSGFDGSLVGLKPGDWYVRVEERTGTVSRKRTGNVIDSSRLSRLPEGAENLFSSSSDEDGEQNQESVTRSPSLFRSLSSQGLENTFMKRLRNKKEKDPAALSSVNAAILTTVGVAATVGTPSVTPTDDGPMASLAIRNAGAIGRSPSPVRKINPRTSPEATGSSFKSMSAWKEEKESKGKSKFGRSHTSTSLQARHGKRLHPMGRDHHVSLEDLPGSARHQQSSREHELLSHQSSAAALLTADDKGKDTKNKHKRSPVMLHQNKAVSAEALI